MAAWREAGVCSALDPDDAVALLVGRMRLRWQARFQELLLALAAVVTVECERHGIQLRF